MADLTLELPFTRDEMGTATVQVCASTNLLEQEAAEDLTHAVRSYLQAVFELIEAEDALEAQQRARVIGGGEEQREDGYRSAVRSAREELVSLQVHLDAANTRWRRAHSGTRALETVQQG